MSRETSAENKSVLKRLLASPDNRLCADCKAASHPRWASWNLGVFLCIRCSGVHRSLGTHISKVRSVDLDTWSDSHLEELKRWGNRRANLYWEAKLTPNYKPDDHRLNSFIRSKYETKKWVAASKPSPDEKENVPLSEVKASLQPSMDLLDLGPARSEPRTSPQRTPTTPCLVDFGEREPQPEPRVQTTQPKHSAPSHASINMATAFGNFRSTPNLTMPTPTKEAPTRTGPPTPEPVGRANANADRTNLKKSILSLYAQRQAPSGLARAETTPVVAPISTQSTPTPPPQQPSLVHQSSSSSALHSLSGLEFAPAPAPSAPQIQSKLALDDDEFNVWG